MALLGVRPSPDELDEVRSHPESLERIVRGYTDDPRFGETIRDMHAEQLHLRWDVVEHLPPEGPLSRFSLSEIVAATDEAPLKLIEWVVTTGQPYSEILTTDVVLANEVTALAYGLPFDPEGPPWQESHWPDGRPAGGILVDNSVWIRFPSSSVNFQRSRAVVAAELVCDALAERPLAFDVFEPGTPAAVSEDPACLACHSVLDPLASAFWGARPWIISADVREAYARDCPDDLAHACYPVQMWDPSEVWSEQLQEELGLGAPAWYGTPVSSLGELGQTIAADPRFASCAARRFWSWFQQVPVYDVPFELWGPLTDAFVEDALDARELALRVVLHPDFDRALTVRPEQYARFVEDLTGYQWKGSPDGPGCAPWCVGEIDLARNDLWGNHTLMGGADGYYALYPNPSPSPARFLAQSWLAEEAAAHVVQHDLSAPAEQRRLLRAADPTDVSDEAVRRQLVWLHQRIGAEREPDIEPALVLFQQALERHGAQAAWQLVITGLLLDAAVY